MLATSLIALSLAGQAPAGAPPGPAALKVNEVVTVGPTMMGRDLQSLNELLYLESNDPGPAQAKLAAIRELEARGRAVELTRPARVVIEGIGENPMYRDPSTLRPLLVYRGRLLDGADGVGPVCFLASQLAAPARPPRPPARLNEKERTIYRAARAALNAAKTRANQADLSIRKRVLARETEAALVAVGRKNVVKRYELDEIIRRGDLENEMARTNAEANNPARLAARAENQAMLGAIGARLDAASAQFAAQAATQPGLRLPAPTWIPRLGPSALSPSGSPYLSGPGHPMDRNTYRDGPALITPTRRGPNGP